MVWEFKDRGVCKARGRLLRLGDFWSVAIEYVDGRIEVFGDFKNQDIALLAMVQKMNKAAERR